jgi:hypothetical protein
VPALVVVLIDARTAAQGAEVVPVVVCAFIYIIR